MQAVFYYNAKNGTTETTTVMRRCLFDIEELAKQYLYAFGNKKK